MTVRDRSIESTRNGRRIVAPILLACAVLSGGPIAIAQSGDAKVHCAGAYEQGQRARKASGLLGARKHFLVCSDESCPAVLRKDCAQWLSEVDSMLPTVVFVATEAGKDLADVRVHLDGDLVADRLDGKAVAVDPGAHVFRFTRVGAIPIEKRVVISEGEKSRKITVSFGAGESAEVAARERPVDADSRGDSGSGVPAASWVLGGIGVLGVGGFTYFALKGRAQKSELDKCAPRCNPEDVSDAKHTFVVGDVLLGVGVVSLASAVIVYFARGSAGKSAVVHLTPQLGPTFAGLGAFVRF